MSDIDMLRHGFDASWYDEEYFAGSKGGKRFRKVDGSIGQWSYFCSTGWWEGCRPIAKAWKSMFSPGNMLDIGCGRGAFVLAARDEGIEAYGFDFSEYAINNLCTGCEREWFKVHDATKPWPYPDKSFDLCIALDFFEHLYVDDIPFVVEEMYRVAKKWVFLEIAIVGGGSGYGKHEEGYILKKGEPIPQELEGNTVAGHVTVQPSEFWFETLERDNVIFRRDMVEWFKALVPSDVIKNWLQNLIVVVEVL